MDIFYIVHYDIQDKKNSRLTSLATINYANYIADTFHCLGYNVQIVSPLKPNKKGIYPTEENVIRDGIKLILFKSFYAKNIVLRTIRKIHFDCLMCKYIKKNIKPKDLVIIGHLPSLNKIAKIIKKTIQAKLIYQIGEIFGFVNNKENIVKKEYKAFKFADAYIVSNDKLGELLSDNKPYAIAYGAYELHQSKKEKFTDGKIHCVYAGVLKPDKGVGLVLDCSKYLDEKYCIHILGFGTDEEINNLKKQISINQKMLKCQVIYEGLMLGNDFTKFISSCHIGISPQSIYNTYNDFAFPSKILTYFAANLEVVSSKVRVVYESKISDFIYFYDENNPKNLADAIMNIKIDSNSKKNIVNGLDSQFKSDVTNIMEKIFNNEDKKNKN